MSHHHIVTHISEDYIYNIVGTVEYRWYNLLCVCVLSVGGSAAGLTYLACQSETVVERRNGNIYTNTRHDDGAGPAVDNEGTALHVFKLKDDYYQMLGHAWDHEVKDFKVVYR